MNSEAARNEFNPVQLPQGMIRQSARGQGVTSATAALYDYAVNALPVHAVRIIEAGSGSGVLAILLKQANPLWQISALEIQASLHNLAVQNATDLNLKIDFINTDLRFFSALTGYDFIISNPPWQKVGSGLLSPVPERAVSRSELYCTMRDILLFCSRNLVQSGNALLLYPQSRKQDMLSELSKLGMKLVGTKIADPQSLIFHLIKDKI